MEQSMLGHDVPSGTSNIPPSTHSVDELLRDHEVRSGWKVVSTANLLTMCHDGTCAQCSSSLEHLLIANRAGEMCACPADLTRMLDRAWPATMGDIREDVASPLLGEIENANHVITDRDDEIAYLRGEVNRLRAKHDEETARRRRIEERLSRVKGTQRDTPLTATSASSLKQRAASPLISEQAAGSLQSESRPAMETSLKKQKLWSPWEEPDAFNPDVLTTSESEHSDGQAAPPKGHKKKVTLPTKQGGAPTPVADLPMVVTGMLPCPLGKVATHAAPQTWEWYEECDLESNRFQELLQVARTALAAGRM